MPVARLPKLLSSALIAFVLSVSGASAAPAVVATLTKSVDNGTTGGDQTVRLHSGVSVTGFAANKSGVVRVKIWSLDDEGADRTKYADLEYQITTDTNGAASTLPETTSKAHGFFSGDEKMTGPFTWDDIKAKFFARKFKIYVTVEINGVEKEIEYTTPVTGAGSE